MDIKDLLPHDDSGRLRIIQETVPGNQISLAHIIGSPQPIIYQKLGLNPDIDYDGSAIGIMTLCPSETAVIAADICTKAGDIYLGFVDRFAGTLIITGAMSEVENAVQEVVDYFKTELGFACCKITKR
ncbi:MAG: BMC domain-containing protein [Anaerovoracaceae bacterium]|jgi:ethanolamine utilization protein EutS